MKPEQFQKLISTEKLPLIVDFWAPWCGPCKVTKPILEKIASEFTGKVKFVQINADESQALLKELKVLGIPTLIAYRDGKEATRVIGAKPANQFYDLFKSLSEGTPIKKAGTSYMSFLLRAIAGGAFLYLGYQGNDPIFYALGAIVVFSLLLTLYAKR